MLSFTVLESAVVTVDPDSPTPILSTVVDPPNPRIVARQAAQRRFDAARRLPGFQGYSLRPGCDIVLNGVHQPYPAGL